MLVRAYAEEHLFVEVSRCDADSQQRENEECVEII